MSVLNLEALNAGNVSLSRNNGFASISFLSSTSIMFRADFVSPYLESCSFCLYIYKQIIITVIPSEVQKHITGILMFTGNCQESIAG